MWVQAQQDPSDPGGINHCESDVGTDAKKSDHTDMRVKSIEDRRNSHCRIPEA